MDIKWLKTQFHFTTLVDGVVKHCFSVAGELASLDELQAEMFVSIGAAEKVDAPGASVEKPLEELTKKELVNLAMEKYSVELSGELKKDDLIAEIQLLGGQ